MAAPEAPILVLRKGDDAVSAFITKKEAIEHFTSGHGKKHGFGDDASGAEFFDARGRRLEPVTKANVGLADLRLLSDESHADNVRQRVRRRTDYVRRVLERNPDEIPGVESALSVLDEDVPFKVLVRRLADLLSTGGPVQDPTEDSRGWWHNTFSH